MGQKKLIRFEEIKTFENVFEKDCALKGKWNTYFKNENPITLELACGKGEYTTGLAELYPNRNFIGIDIKGNRIWKGAKTALEKKLDNVAFLRIQIDSIADYFDEDEINEIWITFPDPQLRISKIKKRLTHPKFLRKYNHILKHNGIIHLKTDSPDLFNFTNTVISVYKLKVVSISSDLYNEESIAPELNIKTHYEGLDIAGSSKIFYIAFNASQNLPVENDEILKNIIREKAVEGRR